MKGLSLKLRGRLPQTLLYHFFPSVSLDMCITGKVFLFLIGFKKKKKNFALLGKISVKTKQKIK
jgi:hypothetical protein